MNNKNSIFLCIALFLGAFPNSWAQSVMDAPKVVLTDIPFEITVTENSSLDFCSLCHVTYERTSTMDPTRLDDIPPRRAVTVTGITPVLHDISDEIYLELVETMLPASLALVALAMIILHRNAKVLVICGLPIAMSLFITFGTTVVCLLYTSPRPRDS